MRYCVHFVGFRGEEYWSAVKVWGLPDFIHRGWDKRANREILDGDTVVFAGDHGGEPKSRSYNDIDEKWL